MSTSLYEDDNDSENDAAKDPDFMSSYGREHYVSVGVPSHAVCLCVCWCSVTRCLSMCLLVFRHTLFVYVTVGVPSHYVLSLIHI